MWTVDAAIDQGQQDAYLRAIGYLTAGYAATIRAQPPQFAPAPWRDHRAYSRLRLKPLRREEGAPADTPTTAYRQWSLTVLPTGRDGWRGRRTTAVLFVTLTRPGPGSPWRISGITSS
jgi:hypothetical protein